MDDFLWLAHKRWPLRRAISRLHVHLLAGGFELHPDKTQLGRVAQCFDWMGRWFTPEGIGIAPRALANFKERRARLYERAIEKGQGKTAALERVRAYETRWYGWTGLYYPAPALQLYALP